MTNPPPDDAALLRDVADGDEHALRTLFERHAPWLRIRLGRRCGDPDAVADVLQDTFVAVWRTARAFRGDGSGSRASPPSATGCPSTSGSSWSTAWWRPCSRSP